MQTYYGRMSDTLPKKGFYYMLLDEHVKNIVSKNIDYFKNQCEEVYKDFRKNNLEEIKALKAQQSTLNKELKTVIKHIEKLDKAVKALF